MDSKQIWLCVLNGKHFLNYKITHKTLFNNLSRMSINLFWIYILEYDTEYVYRDGNSPGVYILKQVEAVLTIIFAIYDELQVWYSRGNCSIWCYSDDVVIPIGKNFVNFSIVEWAWGIGINSEKGGLNRVVWWQNHDGNSFSKLKRAYINRIKKGIIECNP